MAANLRKCAPILQSQLDQAIRLTINHRGSNKGMSSYIDNYTFPVKCCYIITRFEFSVIMFLSCIKIS